MEKRTPALNTLPKKARIAIISAIVVPVAIAVLFTQMQWYPATIIAEAMADENGYFPLKSVILMNAGAVMLVELLILLIILLIRNIFFKKKSS